MGNMTHVKRSRFTLGICWCMPPVCIWRCTHVGVCVCVFTDARVWAMRVSLCFLGYSLWEAKRQCKSGASSREKREWKRKSHESWVWISLKCSIWWVIIFTKAAKSILFPQRSRFYPLLPACSTPHSFLMHCQLVSVICLFFRWVFQCMQFRGMSAVF